MAQAAPDQGWNLTRRQKTRVIATTVIRIIISAIFIWVCLGLVPEEPASKGLVPVLLVALGVTIYILTFRRQLRDIRNAEYPMLRSIEALIFVAMMFLAIFAAIYVMISAADQAAFTEPLNHFTAYYFSLTVLATVGFGDITPVTTGARLACMFQMAIDIAFIAVTVRVLSSAAKQGIAARRARQQPASDGEARQ